MFVWLGLASWVGTGIEVEDSESTQLLRDILACQARPCTVEVPIKGFVLIANANELYMFKRTFAMWCMDTFKYIRAFAIMSARF